MSAQRIVVVGGGVLGSALTHRLTEDGADVVLLDRYGQCTGTSRWSLAWLNSNGKTPRAYHDLSVHSMSAWARLAERAGGGDWYRPVGNLRWEDDPQRRTRLAERVGRLRDWGYEAELLDRDKAAALEPALALPREVGEVAWYPGEGYVLTERLVHALLRRAADAGAEIRTGDAGHVTAVGAHDVRTADGARLAADAVVLCGGRWTPELTRLAGAEVPVVDPAAPDSAAPGLVVRAGPVSAPPLRVLHTPLVHLRAHGAGEVHLEAGDVTVQLDTGEAELDRLAQLLLDRARRVVPALHDAEVTARRVCVRPLPPDGLPIVGALGGGGERYGSRAGADVAEDSGSGGPYVVVTHSGVTLAAGLAETVTRELRDGAPSPALEPFRPGRLR